MKDQAIRRSNFSYNTVVSSLTSTPSTRNGRLSVFSIDEHRTTNGGNAIIDIGSDETYYPSMIPQLQVIDETV
ncbi:unnamed protein product [Rotaria sp. Silwood2]|nr:unnamed protein product [Rotaria sp. Silwood2]CAF2790011.1 unnamed protein product [Rotaria sp. Silwood2]CAF3164274.1 unnamed protein product [Rotaria sp. Silwood2]CAF4262731.1 unnamed protein product [Rotaria sp. Silwood2]CAF4360166.1 unnamed protein product [Rotaria sp. Silwood2]